MRADPVSSDVQAYPSLDKQRRSKAHIRTIPEPTVYRTARPMSLDERRAAVCLPSFHASEKHQGRFLLPLSAHAPAIAGNMRMPHAG